MQWTETATGDRWSSGQDHQIWGQVGHARGRRPWRPRTVDTSGGCGAGQVTIVPRAGGRRGRARPVLIRPGLRAWQGHPGRPMPRARCRRARRAPSPASSGGGGGVPRFPGTVSQRHVKSRGESASGCSRGGRFPVPPQGCVEGAAAWWCRRGSSLSRACALLWAGKRAWVGSMAGCWQCWTPAGDHLCKRPASSTRRCATTSSFACQAPSRDLTSRVTYTR